MKKLQKGFSLVELLVVVAIIGVLAGVGIVGYQSYTDSAKSRVAVANFNSVKRFVETELTLLNNNIQTVSGALKSGTGNCNAINTAYTVHSVDMENFLKGLSCYFATDGYGNAFKNPYDAAGGNQVVYAAGGVAADKKVKGAIEIRHAASDGEVVGGETVSTDSYPIASDSTKGYFVVQYYTASLSTGSNGEYKAKLFTLK